MNGNKTPTITNNDRRNKMKQLHTHVPLSTTFTANVEVHGRHQAGARVTVQPPQLDLAAGAGLRRSGLERQKA